MQTGTNHHRKPMLVLLVLTNVHSLFLLRVLLATEEQLQI